MSGTDDASTDVSGPFCAYRSTNTGESSSRSQEDADVGRFIMLSEMFVTRLLFESSLLLGFISLVVLFRLSVEDDMGVNLLGRGL
jgi:hypothetical protein